MSEIIPAIIPKHFDDLEEKLGIVAGRVPFVHIDVMNGTFTRESAWPYAGDITQFLQITEETEGFPYWEDVSFEAHLMVKDAEDIFEDWIKAGAERIIVHLETFPDPSSLSRFLALLKNRFSPASSYLGVEAGLAVNLDTPLEAVLPHVLEADFIHLMSIDHDGRQGELFDERIFERIKELKEKFPETIISVDGGVSIENAEALKEAGADRLVIGSAIFAAESPEDALHELLEVV